MAKKARDRKSPSTRNDTHNDRKRKPTGEIKDRDLDKVVGGWKATGDPCDGGENK